MDDFVPDKWEWVYPILAAVFAALAGWFRGKGKTYATGLRMATDAIEQFTYDKSGHKVPAVEDIKGTLQVTAAAIPAVDRVVTYTAAESQSAASLATSGTYKQGQDKQDVKDHP